VSNVNFHVHTHYSDGVKSVKEVIDGLKKAGVTAFSITDHDDCRAALEASKIATKVGLKFVSGVELSAVFNGEGNLYSSYICHILGYNIDSKKMQSQLDVYSKMGRYPSIKSQIDLIHKCGGLAVWAHPFNIIDTHRMITLDREKVAWITKNMVELGIDGLEVYYQDYSETKIEFLEDLAYEHDLLKSVGTDYHGHVHRVSNELKFSRTYIIPHATILDKIRFFRV